MRRQQLGDRKRLFPRYYAIIFAQAIVLHLAEFSSLSTLGRVAAVTYKAVIRGAVDLF